jgi:hypothetical protein
MVTASAVLFQASCGLNRPPISTKTLLGHLYRGAYRGTLRRDRRISDGSELKLADRHR